MSTAAERLAEYRRKTDPLHRLLPNLHTMKGDKGDKGERGFNGTDGKDGRNGVNGRDGSNGLHGKDGKNGLDGKDGKDGKDGINGTAPTLDEITKELRKKPINYKEIEDAPDLKDLPALIEFLKRGGFRGGGSSASGSVTIYTETPVGLINGVNKIYTTLHVINTVVGMWINGEYIHPAEYTAVGAGFTMSTAIDASLSGTGFTISYT